MSVGSIINQVRQGFKRDNDLAGRFKRNPTGDVFTGLEGRRTPREKLSRKILDCQSRISESCDPVKTSELELSAVQKELLNKSTVAALHTSPEQTRKKALALLVQEGIVVDVKNESIIRQALLDQADVVYA